MFGILRRIFRALTWDEPRHRPSPPTARERATKKPALSTVETSAILDDLPRAKVMRVLDGDTLIVAKGWNQTTIRLDSIDCPEDGQPWGNIAKAGLIKLVGGRRVVLEEHGTDPHGRTLATIYVRHANGHEWLNVNERMVTLGHAWVMRIYYDHLPNDRQTKLNHLEGWAKSKKVGLWRTENPIPPWQWRKLRDTS
jgi:endonuclease YncB( thermonuclease family)